MTIDIRHRLRRAAALGAFVIAAAACDGGTSPSPLAGLTCAFSGSGPIQFQGRAEFAYSFCMNPGRPTHEQRIGFVFSIQNRGSLETGPFFIDIRLERTDQPGECFSRLDVRRSSIAPGRNGSHGEVIGPCLRGSYAFRFATRPAQSGTALAPRDYGPFYFAVS
jgi:hypothetical protein